MNSAIIEINESFMDSNFSAFIKKKSFFERLEASLKRFCDEKQRKAIIEDQLRLMKSSHVITN